MKKLKIISLIYATAVEIACFSYFDINPIRLILMGLFAVLLNVGLYMVYDYAMEHKILGALEVFLCVGVALTFMYFLIQAGERVYGLPFYVWILTSQESLNYTAYYTFAMFFLIIIYISGLVYYSTLNRYVLSVNFLVLLLPFASFARDDNMLHMWIAIPCSLLFFLTFIFCRQSLTSTVLPKEFKGKKLSYVKKHNIELRRIRRDLGKKEIVNISILTSVIFSACLLFPKPALVADRTFFESAIDAQSFMDYLSRRFDIFTEVADPDVFKRNTSEYELFRVKSDEKLRLKGRDYDNYNFENGSWNNTFPYEITAIRKSADLSFAEILLDNRRYRPTSTLYPTSYNGYYELTGSSGYGVKYYSDKNVYDDETFNYLAYEVTDEKMEESIANSSEYVRETEYPDVLEKYAPDKYVIPENIVKFAEDVTEGLDSDFLRALAIEKFLSEDGGYIYDLNYQSTDINDFLFGEKRGVCYEFATAMTLMSRAVGIPSRFATGFAVYQFDEEEKCYIIREKNAHAFPELYFIGYGWISFEPTASIQDAAQQAATAAAAVTEDKLTPTQAASVVFAILALLSIVFYYLLLPLIKEKLFQSKLKKAPPALAYSLAFNRLRELFDLPSSSTLEDTVNIADIYFPLDRKFITSVIYDNAPSNPQIATDYVTIFRNFKRK
jgi:transglutaminase-like putative cysteine protease